LLLSGEVPDEEEGVWLMNADGTNRRRVCESGSPFWSPDGSLLLLNGWSDPTDSRIYSFATKRTTRVEVPGQKFYSWPRWAGPGQLVAGIGGETAPDSIVLVDVSQPSEAKVVRTLWRRSSGPNVYPRWPAVSPSSGDCFFIGVVGDTRTLYSLSQDAAGQVRLSALEVGGPQLAGLNVSGDGRYLLFDSDRLDRKPRGGAPATIGDRATQEVDRLAGVLRRNPPRDAARTGVRMQLYMRDLLEDRTILIADEPVPGLSWTGAPDWSHDGTRIVFDTSPGKDWVKSRLMILEAGDGKPSLRDIGAGNCARFSPDDQQLTFVLNDGAVPGDEWGVYLMRADGTNRRRIGNFGAPFWSGDGRQLLINAFSDPTKCNIYTLSTGETETISLPGQKIFSWPRWAGPGMLVACIGTGDEPDSIVLLDVTVPAQARIVETLWRRGRGQDVYARWPLFLPATGACYFVGVEGSRRTLLSIRRGAGGRAIAVEGDGHDDELGGLTFSPDGRYMLFGANRPDRAGTPAPASFSTAAAQEALRLAEVLREYSPRPSKGPGAQMQVYLRDLVEDRTTLVADEPILGHVWCGNPDWSHDGTKILFDASTDMWTRSRLMVLERRDGQPRMRDLGPGLCGKFSPDDRRIVFALNPGDPRDQAGIWVMKADGTDRTRLITDAYGAPSWSDDRRQILINTFNDPARSYVYDFPTRETTQVVVPGLKIFSWPRWAGPHTLVASLGAQNEPVAIDLLDILRPGQARVERRLWRRSDGPDIYARWPLYESSTGACYFLGARGGTRAILKASGGPGKPGAVPIEGGERPDRMGGLSVSPDGRFLVFNADRPDRAAGGHPR
jgi:Tol biopolymer transport system component